MKKKIFIGIGVILLLFIGYVGYLLLTTRSHSPFKETMHSYQGLDLKVTFCQPYKKDRLIFGSEGDGALVPYGKYWRLGANDATEITFSKNATFAGKAVTAGTYRMYAVPDADKWQVSLNSELGKFGAFEPDYTLDVLKVDVPSTTLSSALEQFTIDFEEGANEVIMNMKWDETVVKIPISL